MRKTSNCLMSYYARRAICYISDICMPYILASADLGSV